MRHAWSASLLGDDYARRLGRVSLNPLRHLTPLGTLAILLLPFGWGRPVPVNLYNFKHPKRDYLLTSLAGPAANLILVAVGLGLMALTRHSFALGPEMVSTLVIVHMLLAPIVIINGILAVFNLIPVPPLDGSKIWPCLLGSKAGSSGKGSRVFLIVLAVLMFQGVLNPLFRVVTGGLTAPMPASDFQLYSRQMDAGQTAAKSEHWAQAESHFSKALAVNPASADAFVGRAIVLMQQGKLHESLNDMNAAVSLAPESPQLYQIRAVLLTRLGRLKEMQQDIATYERLTHASTTRPAATQP